MSDPTPATVALSALPPDAAFTWRKVIYVVADAAYGGRSTLDPADNSSHWPPADRLVHPLTAAECRAWVVECKTAAQHAETAYSEATAVYDLAAGNRAWPLERAFDSALIAAQKFGAALVAREYAARQLWIARRALTLAQAREGAGNG